MVQDDRFRMAVPFRSEKFIVGIYLPNHTVVNHLIVDCALLAAYCGRAKLDLDRCHVSRIWFGNTSPLPLKAPQSPGSASQGRWYTSPACRVTPSPSSPRSGCATLSQPDCSSCRCSGTGRGSPTAWCSSPASSCPPSVL